MTVTNRESGTQIDEIAAQLFRISTPIAPNPQLPPGFSFNQFLIAAEQPLLFHTGPRRMFPLVQEAVRHVLPPESLHLAYLFRRSGVGQWTLYLLSAADSRASRMVGLGKDSYLNRAVAIFGHVAQAPAVAGRH